MKYGKDIEKQTLLLTEKYKDFVQSFNCGNEVMDNYLKDKAIDDPQATTFITIDVEDQTIIGYYTLSCSGLVLTHGYDKITVYPAVEIKMFAIDEKYQHLPYSDDEDYGNLSSMLFSDVIGHIYQFTDEQCGADKILLHSVPDAHNFYLRSGFSDYEEFMKPSTSLFTDGCIPMYMDL